MRNLAFLILFVASAAMAEDIAPLDHLPTNEPCSLETLQGTYLFSGSGFTVSGPDAASRKPVAQAGWEAYDGRGHVRGVYTYSENGVITRGTYTAIYTMEPNCTGTIVINDSEGTVTHFDLFAVPGSDDLVWIQTDPGLVFAGWDRRRTRVRAGSSIGRH
jgi:hypothetical protein